MMDKLKLVGFGLILLKELKLNQKIFKKSLKKIKKHQKY